MSVVKLLGTLSTFADFFETKWSKIITRPKTIRGS